MIDKTIEKFHTWSGCSLCKACLSAAKSQRAGGAKPVSDSLIPLNSEKKWSREINNLMN